MEGEEQEYCIQMTTLRTRSLSEIDWEGCSQSSSRTSSTACTPSGAKTSKPSLTTSGTLKCQSGHDNHSISHAPNSRNLVTPTMTFSPSAKIHSKPSLTQAQVQAKGATIHPRSVRLSQNFLAQAKGTRIQDLSKRSRAIALSK
jgi:hypothetical protein